MCIRDRRPVWLPIDAKFPLEDYQRLLDAQERGDPAALDAAVRGLELRLRDEARKIHDKYVEPPYTTDFAILYLPTEGLYAEALRRPGLVDVLSLIHISPRRLPCWGRFSAAAKNCRTSSSILGRR